MPEEEKVDFEKVKVINVTAVLEPSESSRKLLTEMQIFREDKEVIDQKMVNLNKERDTFLEDLDFSRNSRKDYIILNDYLKESQIKIQVLQEVLNKIN